MNIFTVSTGENELRILVKYSLTSVLILGHDDHM